MKTSTSFWLRAEWNFTIKGMLSFSNCVIYNFLFSISDVLKLLQKDRHVSKTKDLRLLFRSQPPIFGDYFHRQCNYWRHTGPRFGSGSGGIATCAQGSWNWIQVNLIKNPIFALSSQFEFSRITIVCIFRNLKRKCASKGYLSSLFYLVLFLCHTNSYQFLRFFWK